jgi:hypothetical protein
VISSLIAVYDAVVLGRRCRGSRRQVCGLIRVSVRRRGVMRVEGVVVSVSSIVGFVGSYWS